MASFFEDERERGILHRAKMHSKTQYNEDSTLGNVWLRLNQVKREVGLEKESWKSKSRLGIMIRAGSICCYSTFAVGIVFKCLGEKVGLPLVSGSVRIWHMILYYCCYVPKYNRTVAYHCVCELSSSTSTSSFEFQGQRAKCSTLLSLSSLFLCSLAVSSHCCCCSIFNVNPFSSSRNCCIDQFHGCHCRRHSSRY